MVNFTFTNSIFFADFSGHVHFFIRFFFDLKIMFEYVKKYVLNSSSDYGLFPLQCEAYIIPLRIHFETDRGIVYERAASS